MPVNNDPQLGSVAKVVAEGRHHGNEVVDGAISGGSADGVTEFVVVVDVLFGVVDGSVDVKAAVQGCITWRAGFLFVGPGCLVGAGGG